MRWRSAISPTACAAAPRRSRRCSSPRPSTFICSGVSVGSTSGGSISELEDILNERLQEWLGYINSEIHKSYSPLFSGFSSNPARLFATSALIHTSFSA